MHAIRLCPRLRACLLIWGCREVLATCCSDSFHTCLPGARLHRRQLRTLSTSHHWAWRGGRVTIHMSLPDTLRCRELERPLRFHSMLSSICMAVVVRSMFGEGRVLLRQIILTSRMPKASGWWSMTGSLHSWAGQSLAALPAVHRTSADGLVLADLQSAQGKVGRGRGMHFIICCNDAASECARVQAANESCYCTSVLVVSVRLELCAVGMSGAVVL
jgi:hypothetical protein